MKAAFLSENVSPDSPTKGTVDYIGPLKDALAPSMTTEEVATLVTA